MRRNIFVDREAELQQLESLWSKPAFSLVFVFGRRRVGKTRLLTEFAKEKTGVYYVAAQAPYEALCKEFSDSTKRSLGLPFSGDIIEVTESVTNATSEKILIVVDEFQYVVEVDASFPSRLQRLIDSELSQRNLILILCGSAVSFFEEKLLGYRSPLFGRRTATLKLKPLSFPQIKGFFPNYSIEDLLNTYAVIGGTPAYLEKLSGAKSFKENLRNIVTPENYLYDEAQNILRQEVREPRTYFSILSSIAEGKTSQSEAASVAQVDPRSIVKYIDLLEELEILTRVRPLGYRKPVKLQFKDNYFRFWFTYPYKLRTLLETGYVEESLNHILETFNIYLSRVFEDVIAEIAPLLHQHGLIETKPVQIGKWWHKDTEIDTIIREPGKSTTFIETKWSRIKHNEAEKILKEVEEKAAKTGLASPENHYLLVAKEITDETTPIKPEKHRKIIDLKTLNNILKPTATKTNKQNLNPTTNK
ncbi:MAG: ATP-binding protein [Candidatus Jordarchaeum sp.]|uniref:ATP-binding protein n=1 Tax=Candidatus Jordarchaeum sp. TaxID=2823881 RepID=UPI00404B7CC2